MEPTDLTLHVLESIRDEIRGTNSRLDQTNSRLDQTNERLEAVRSELGRRIVESEVRTSTAITGLAGSVQNLADLLRAQHDLRPRVEKCERDIEGLKKRKRGS